ncbi:HNH endonuclease [Salicibibacter cibarius]|uniref:HNH endonuclease n=1 Tax=Salicibibacter cibarius TaxID=2743000 RepID=A0A7T6YZJ9_9BACI|nr:HNH endonuclease signature motif containing protein [Salicibibacter cibarius]QQK74215.1 HNH endonuclease [Salicibibacter cibarius]
MSNQAECKHCHKTKPVSEFRRDRRRKHGIINVCKPCRNHAEKSAGNYHRVYFMRHKRKSEQQRNQDVLTYDQYKDLVQRDSCPYCGIANDSNTTFTIDHITPKPKGPHSQANITYCCASCNAAKGTRDLLTFFEQSKSFTLPLFLTFLSEWAQANGQEPADMMDHVMFGYQAVAAQ